MSLDDDFCVAIAHDGTIEGTTQHLDLKTRCYDDALQCERLEELKRDLEFVASPLVPQDTFWLGAGETPRCALEAVVLEIFRKLRETEDFFLQVSSTTHGMVPSYDQKPKKLATKQQRLFQCERRL